MNRCFAFFCACLLSLVSISSACLSAPTDVISFNLSPEQGGGADVYANFRSGRGGRDRNNWTTDFRTGDLVGLDLSGFRAAGTRPLRFALMREAGRLDCAGEGGGSHAFGSCRFTPDAGFAQALAHLGVGRTTAHQAFALMSLNVRRATAEAIIAARFPAPTVDELIGLTALGVDGEYIRAMAGAGYRLRSIDELMQFKALGITPAWIGSFVRAGYRDLPADDLVQLKALGITPGFIAGFERIGYGRLSVDSLVQLKALGVTPDWAQAIERRHGRRPDVDQLVQMKALGVER